jgi:hypothetical protein
VLDATQDQSGGYKKISSCSDGVPLRLLGETGPRSGAKPSFLPNRTMTRYTNVGWKRTYHQASSDPNDDQIARSAPSTPVPGSSDAAAQFESTNDTPAESNRKRRRKSKADPEREVVAESTPAAIATGEDKTSSSASEKKRTKILAGRPKPRTKEKTRRAKSV